MTIDRRDTPTLAQCRELVSRECRKAMDCARTGSVCHEASRQFSTPQRAVNFLVHVCFQASDETNCAEAAKLVQTAVFDL